MRITKQLILPLLILNIFSLSSFAEDNNYLEQLELPIDTQELKLTNSYISNNLLSVNFAWNTAFSAIICTKWGCSHSFGLGSSYKVPLIIGEEVCVSVSVDPLLTASRYNYYFKMEKDEAAEVNFKGFSVYPKFTYSDSLKYVESKTNFYRIPCYKFYLERLNYNKTK